MLHFFYYKTPAIYWDTFIHDYDLRLEISFFLYECVNEKFLLNIIQSQRTSSYFVVGYFLFRIGNKNLSNHFILIIKSAYLAFLITGIYIVIFFTYNI